MKETLNKEQFIDKMLAFQNSQHAHNFTILGLESLYDYLMDTDENIEYEPMVFCCSYEEISEKELHSNEYKDALILTTFKNQKETRHIVSRLYTE